MLRRDIWVVVGICSVSLAPIRTVMGAEYSYTLGYTAEYDIQLYLKRAKWARPAFGDADFHYERVAALGGL